MRIVHVMHSPFLGGAERYVSRVSREWNKAGNRESILIGTNDTWGSDSGANIAGAGSWKWSLRNMPKAILTYRRESRAVLSRFKGVDSPDLVVAHLKKDQVLAAFNLSQLAPVVWIEHGVFPRGIFGRAIAPLYRRASKNVCAVWCVSDRVKEDIVMRVHPSTPVHTLASGVDVEDFNPINWVSRKPGSEIRALFVGRLTESKRPMLAVDACRLGGASLRIAGTGPMGERIRSTDVELLGERTDVAGLMGKTDVHLFMSDGEGEGMPTVLLEAAAAGVPSICITGCGYEEVVRSSGGLVSDPHPSSIWKAIVQIDGERALRAEMARTWAVENASYDVFLARFASLAADARDSWSKRSVAS